MMLIPDRRLPAYPVGDPTKLLFLITAAAVAVPVTVQAAGNAADQSGPADSIVTGSRISDSVQTFPGSVSVVGEKEIRSQLGTTLGISNLLNNDYYTVTSQMLNRNERYSKALGRTVFIQIGIDY